MVNDAIVPGNEHNKKLKCSIINIEEIIGLLATAVREDDIKRAVKQRPVCCLR